MNKTLLLRQLDLTFQKFPKLRVEKLKEFSSWALHGDLDICDLQGNYWQTFDIVVLIDERFPNSVPVVLERSKLIPREKCRHISVDGICCLEIDHILLLEAQKGIVLSSFMENYVYPYFANQVFFENSDDKQYANGEWAHEFDGIVQFYEYELELTDHQLIIRSLENIISVGTPSRNQMCFCQKKKYKYCDHRKSFEFLQRLPKERIIEDLAGFRSLVSE